MKAYSDYLLFQPDDFLRDTAFRQWIAGPTPEMDAYWQGLLRTHPQLRDPFGQAQVLAQGLELAWLPFSDVYTDQLYDQIRPHLTKNRPIRRVNWRVYARFAAAAVVLLVGGLWVNSYYFTGQMYQTAFGENKQLTLYDGSTVTLNAHSQLWLPSRYAWRTERIVELAGEAYFAVTKQPSPDGYRKFIVRTSRVSVEVLGTRFNLYARSQRTAVLLEEGRIQLVERATNQLLLMKPGQVVELNARQNRPHLVKPAPEQTRQLTDWRHNRLVFNDADMIELARRFGEVYGLELLLEDDVFAGQQFRGELPVTDVKEALQILSAAFERKAIRDGKRVYFVRETQ